MKEYISKFISFVRSVFSDGDQGSFTRVSGYTVILFVCGWVSYIVVKTTALPDLTGPGIFIGIVSGGHYAVNNMADIVSAFKGKQ